MRLYRPRTVVAVVQWPGPTNTGVPSGTSLTGSGTFTTSSDGQVVNALDITGNLIVQHSNVTINRCRVTAPVTENTGPIFVASSAHGTLTILDSESDCSNAGGTTGLFFDANADPPDTTIRRSQFHRTENGLGIPAGLVFDIQDSYIFDLNPAGGDPHTDGIQTETNASNVTIKHNTIDMAGPGTGSNNSCLQINTTGNTNWLIENNKLLLNTTTGGATLRFPTTSPADNIRVRNNRLMQGTFGYEIPGDHSTITEWSGNVRDDTGAVIP